MVPRRHPRDAAEGFADLCKWAILADDGLVLTRDGALLAGYYTSPPDPDGETEDERISLCSRLNAALKRFGTGWTLWADIAVVPSAEYPADGFFPDPASRAFDAERRRQFHAEGAHFEAERVLVFCHRPPAAVVRRLSEAFYTGDEDRLASPFAIARAGMASALEQFEDAARDLIRPRRMRSYPLSDAGGRAHHCDELVNYLAYCASGRAHPVRLPDDGAFLDAVIGAPDFAPGETPALGDDLLACVSIDGFPAQSVPGILDALGRMEVPYRFSQRFQFLDPHDAEKEIKGYRRGWKQQIVPAVFTLLGLRNPPINREAVARHAECDVALELARGEHVRFGFYKATVLFRHHDAAALKEMAREARARINGAGFGARVEGVNATEAFMGALPGNTEADLRSPPIHTANLADLMPTAGVWTGLPVNPNPLYDPPGQPALMHARTSGALPFRFNIHVGDLGNYAFFGPPGSGKTTLMNAVSLQALRYRGMRIRGIDIKRGMLVPCLASGGNYHEVGGDGAPAFAPFARLESEEDALWAQAWVEACFHLQTGRKADDTHKTDIYQAIQVMRGRPGHRSITNFVLAVQNAEVRSAMRYYELDGGPGGSLFDGAADDLPASHFDVFDLTAVLNAGDAILMPAVMCLLRRFEREEGGDPMLLQMDEVGVQIDTPAWEPQLVRLLKLKRSKNVAVGLATQNLADMWKGRLLPILQENVPTRAYGANPAAQRGGDGDAKGPADFYKAFGLNEKRRDTVRLMRPKRDYAIDQPDGWRVVEFDFGPIGLALCASTSEADVLRAKALVAEHGRKGFAERWLREKGVDDAILDFEFLDL